MAPIKFGLLAFSLGLVIGACGSGGPGPDDPPTGKAPRDTPSGTYQQPPSTRDTPPTSYQDPAGNGTSAGCVPCDRNYRCSATEQGQTQSIVIHLSTQTNGCGTEDAALACGGSIVDKNGKLDGTWTIAGGTLTLNEGNNFVVTCVQTTDQVPPPTPTTTVTATPGSPAPSGS
jgi:hypothetical protein